MFFEDDCLINDGDFGEDEDKEFEFLLWEGECILLFCY